MTKKVAAIFGYTSAGGPPQKKERIKLAQLIRQIRNMRSVIFSNILLLTFFVSA